MPSTRPCTLGRNDSLAGDTENLRLDDPALSTSSAGRGTPMGIEGPLSREELAKSDAYWRAANYLSVGQIYLYDNPLPERTAHRPARQAAAPRPLRVDAGSEFRLRATQPRVQGPRFERDLYRRAGSRRPRA